MATHPGMSYSKNQDLFPMETSVLTCPVHGSFIHIPSFGEIVQDTTGIISQIEESDSDIHH